MENVLFSLISFAITLFFIATTWQLFSKAGRPGFLALIPIVNVIVLVQIAGKPPWWAFLLMIPLVNIVVGVMVVHGISKNFGHGLGYTLGLVFLGFIFLPMLAWGDSQFEGKWKF